jgi:hypothetical protein
VKRSVGEITSVVALVTALIASAAGLQAVRETKYPRPIVVHQSLYLNSGNALTRATKGYNALAADLYWIRSIQYYGDVRLKLAALEASGQPVGDTQSAFPLLYPLLDLTTTLDPQFGIAYRFGSIFLGEAYPGGAGQPELAIALLEKGLRSRPDKWEYMQDIGFVHYWWRHDFRAAAQWFDRASQVPGAPWFLRSLAADTLRSGGDRRSSRLMWESIRASTDVEWLRNDAGRRLMQLDVLDALPQIQADLEKAAAATGLVNPTWQQLVRARVFRGVPVDPTGTPYEIDTNGTVTLSPESSLYPLPVEPAPGPPPS